MAETEGFEPSIQALHPYNGLANRRLQPLGHVSTFRLLKASAECLFYAGLSTLQYSLIYVASNPWAGV